MNQEFLYIIAIIALGYLLKRMGILKEKDGETISRIIFNITLPALVIVSLNSVKIEPSLIMLPVIVYCMAFFHLFLLFLYLERKRGN